MNKTLTSILKFLISLVIITAFASQLAACGQKGALYIPAEKAQASEQKTETKADTQKKD